MKFTVRLCVFCKSCIFWRLPFHFSFLFFIVTPVLFDEVYNPSYLVNKVYYLRIANHKIRLPFSSFFDTEPYWWALKERNTCLRIVFLGFSFLLILFKFWWTVFTFLCLCILSSPCVFVSFVSLVFLTPPFSFFFFLFYCYPGFRWGL